MGDLSTLMRNLGRDPIMQSMFEAESSASSAIQLKLLDAVLLDDHRQVKEMLEEEDHSRLLPNEFFLPLSVILVGKAAPKVVKAFAEHGYNQTTRPAGIGLSGEVRMGDLALWVCDAARQKELVDCGFLSVKGSAYSGMGSADPAVFDLWSGLYLQDEAAGRKLSPPQATLAIFRFIPDTQRRQSTPISQATRAELDRRLEKMLDGFLSTHYPGPPDTAWREFVANPPNVSQHAANALGCVEYMRALIEHQRKTLPDLLHRPIDADFSNPHMGNRQVILAHALLRLGAPMSIFPMDLPNWVLQKASQALRREENPPEAVSVLWNTVVAKLKDHDPARLDALPRELCNEFVSLRALRNFQDDAERVAFCDMLDMHITAPRALGTSSRPRI